MVADSGPRLGELAETVAQADALILCYACDDVASVRALGSVFLPELYRLGVSLPVWLVGCKADERPAGDAADELGAAVGRLVEEWQHRILGCFECSAKQLANVLDVFVHVQRGVLHPQRPLFLRKTQELTDPCLRALKRIFKLCDRDGDGLLSDAELNFFQNACFGAPLDAEEIRGVKAVVRDNLAAGIQRESLTLEGFFFLHTLFIVRNRMDTTWTALRKFGYGNDLKLRPDYLRAQCPALFAWAPEHNVELTPPAREALATLFREHDRDGDGLLSRAELADLFSTAPAVPWLVGDLERSVQTRQGGVTLAGFLALWDLLLAQRPFEALEHLLYVGFTGAAAGAVRATGRKRWKADAGPPKRVLQCAVLGSCRVAIGTILDNLILRDCPSPQKPKPDGVQRWSAHSPFADGPTLVLREIEEQDAAGLLERREGLAGVDALVFAYDTLSLPSLRTSALLLKQIERSGLAVPCLLVGLVPPDLPAAPQAAAAAGVAEEVRALCAHLTLPAPLKLENGLKAQRTGAMDQLYRGILDALEAPQVWIPETAERRRAKETRLLLLQGATYAAAGIGVCVGCLWAYRAYSGGQGAAGAEGAAGGERGPPAPSLAPPST